MVCLLVILQAFFYVLKAIFLSHILSIFILQFILDHSNGYFKWLIKKNYLLKIPPTSRYDRGFCRHGPHCRHRHVRRVLCINYIAGLCPDGPACKFMHPRFELPAPPEQTKDAKRLPVCHYCSEVGHKASACHKIPQEVSLSSYINSVINSIFFIRWFHVVFFSLGWHSMTVLDFSVDTVVLLIERAKSPFSRLAVNAFFRHWLQVAFFNRFCTQVPWFNCKILVNRDFCLGGK